MGFVCADPGPVLLFGYASELVVSIADCGERTVATLLSAQDDDTFMISRAECHVTRRDIVGAWWSGVWQAKKMIYIEMPDGEKKARESCTQSGSSGRQDNSTACCLRA